MRALCALIRRNFIAARCAALLAPGAFLFALLDGAFAIQNVLSNDGDIGVIEFSVALADEAIAIIAAIPAMFIRELDLMFSPVENQNNLSRCFGLRPLAKPLLAYPCGAGSSSITTNSWEHTLPHRRFHAAVLGHGLNPASRAGCAWTAKHGSRLPVPVSLRPLGF